MADLFIDACYFGYMEEAAELLNTASPIAEALEYACRGNRVHTAEWLINLQTQISAPDALKIALSTGNLRITQLIISRLDQDQANYWANEDTVVALLQRKFWLGGDRIDTGHLDIAKWILQSNPTIAESHTYIALFKDIIASPFSTQIAIWMAKLSPHVFHFKKHSNAPLLRPWFARRQLLWMASPHATDNLMQRIPQDVAKFITYMI